MKRILFIIVAVMAITSCGESPAEKAANQARKDYLKTLVRSTQNYVDSYNKTVDEYNSNLKSGEPEMQSLVAPFDTTTMIQTIDKAKKKDLPDLENRIKELHDMIEKL